MSLAGLGLGEAFAGGEGFAAPGVHLHQVRQHWAGGEKQHVAKWISWTQHSGIARQVQDGSGEPGHSHDPQDKGFSLISAKLAEKIVLQSPDDFVITIRQTLKPIRGRPVFADILHGTWDWVGVFEDLRLNVSGNAASHAHPNVCFSQRFLQLQ